MTKPRIIVSGAMGARELDDSVYAELGYQGLDGLFEPAMVAKGASIATFDGPVRVRPQSTYYEPRTFSLYGYLIGGSGQAEMEQTSHDFFQALSGSNTRFHVGSLYLDCNVTAKPRYDRFKDFTTRRDYRLECEAIPALWGSEYHFAVGGDQGILVRDDRLDHASIKMTDVTGNGRVVQFTYAGSAPTRCALMISGVTSGTTYYIVNPYDGRAVAFTPSAAVHYIPSSAGPWLYPANAGANVLRLQSDTSGTLVASGTYLWALVPSAFVTRYLGNSGDKMTEGPVFSHYRRGVAFAVTDSTDPVLDSSGDMAARIGTAYGYSAAKAGLVLEQASANLILQSKTYSSASWTKSQLTVSAGATTAPDGIASADKLVEAAANAQHYATQSVTTAAINTGSVWLKPAEREWVFIQLGAVGAYFHLSGDGTVGALQGAPTTKIEKFGAWYCCSVSSNAHTPGANAFTVYLSTGDGVVTYLGDGASGLYAWVSQSEDLPFATSPIETTTAAVTRNADYAAFYRPHNYLKYSRDLTQTSAWTVAGTGSAQPTRSGTVADGTASGNLWVIGNTDNRLVQAVTPDVRPNSTAWTAMVSLRLPAASALSGSIKLIIEAQEGTDETALTINTSDLSTTEDRTFFVTLSASTVDSWATGLQFALQGNSGTGNLIIATTGLLKGSFPGAPAHTEGSAIPLPEYGYDWPDWITQNGYVEFTAVLPPISTGLDYAVIGNFTSPYDLLLARLNGATTGQNYLRLYRATNDGNASHTGNVDVGAVWDGAAHQYRLMWLNYTLSGARYMYLRLYVKESGAWVLKSSDSNKASATITGWRAPERLWLSDSYTTATLRGVTYDVPDASHYPAGAVPASP